MTAMNYVLDPELRLFILGTNPDNLYVMPTTVGITLDLNALIGIVKSKVGGGEVTVVSVKAANKYSKSADGQVIVCPNAVLVMTPDCTSVPPKHDAVPSPSTILGAAEIVSRMCVAESLGEAIDRMNAATAPTGFWLLDLGGEQYAAVEVGIDPVPPNSPVRPV